VFTVRNNAATAVQATLSLADWNRDEKGDNRFFPIGTVPGSCGSALSIFPLAMRLEPGAAQTVRVTLDGASPDSLRHECWSIAFVETAPQVDATKGRVINYTVRTGVKVYVGTPQLKADAEVTKLRLARRTPAAAPAPTADAGPDDVLLTVQNTGTRHAIAHGSVEFRRPDNSLAAKVELPDLYILPGASVQTSVPAPKLAPGRYVVLAIVDYHGDDLAAAQLEYEVP